MMKKYLCLLLTMLMIISCLCACAGNKKDENKTDVTPTVDANNAQTETTEPVESTPVGNETLTVFPFEEGLTYSAEIFEADNWYYRALICEYKTASELVVSDVFYSGADDNDELTEEELEFLKEQCGDESILLDVVKLSVDEMNEYLLKYFNTSLSDVVFDKESFIYNESTQCYYIIHSDTNVIVPTFYNVGQEKDGTLVFIYDKENPETDGSCILYALRMAKMEDGRYVALSNQKVDDIEGYKEALGQ